MAKQSLKPDASRLVAVLTAPGRWPMLEFELDIIQSELDRGAKVDILQCKGQPNYCPANNPKPGMPLKKSLCISCKSRASEGFKLLDTQSGSYKIKTFRNLTQAQEERILNVLAAVTRENLVGDFEGFQLSFLEKEAWGSVQSTLMSDLKDAAPNLADHTSRIAILFESALAAGYSTQNYLAANEVDHLYIYNGRMVSYWPARVAAQQAGVPFTIYEFPPFGKLNYVMTPGLIPHSRMQYARLVKKHWKQMVSTSDREWYITAAGKWFEERSRRKLEGQQSVLLGNALDHIETGVMPERWNGELFNLSVFPSSQYEFAGLDNYIGELNLRQPEVIEAVCQAFPQIFVTVRIHPNQPLSDRSFLEKIGALEDLENVQIVWRDSSVDSLALADFSDLILTFSSTISIQSAARGKPVVEAGLPFYSEFKICHGARTTESLLELLSEYLAREPSRRLPRGEVLAGNALSTQAALMAFGQTPKYLELDSQGFRVVRIKDRVSRPGVAWTARIRMVPVEILENPKIFLVHSLDRVLLRLVPYEWRKRLVKRSDQSGSDLKPK